MCGITISQGRGRCAVTLAPARRNVTNFAGKNRRSAVPANLTRFPHGMSYTRHCLQGSAVPHPSTPGTPIFDFTPDLITARSSTAVSRRTHRVIPWTLHCHCSVRVTYTLAAKTMAPLSWGGEGRGRRGIFTHHLLNYYTVAIKYQCRISALWQD